jgi:hypothetical protein
MARPIAVPTVDPRSVERIPDPNPGNGSTGWEARTMFMSNPSAARSIRAVDVALRAAIVGLALSTAYIHFTLGGLLFLANAAGYTTLAVAMIAPVATVSRLRWLIRPALAGFTATTIVGYLIMGPYFTLGFIAKGIEATLIVLLVIEMVRFDGGPLAVARRFLAEAVRISRVTFGPTAA